MNKIESKSGRFKRHGSKTTRARLGILRLLPIVATMVTVSTLAVSSHVPSEAAGNGVHIMVSPASNLVDGQVLSVVVSGTIPASTFVVVEWGLRH